MLRRVDVLFCGKSKHTHPVSPRRTIPLERGFRGFSLFVIVIVFLIVIDFIIAVDFSIVWRWMAMLRAYTHPVSPR